MRNRRCGTFRTVIGKSAFCEQAEKAALVIEAFPHYKIGQFQSVRPAFLDLHHFITSFREERTGRQAHLGGDFRDSVFPGFTPAR